MAYAGTSLVGALVGHLARLLARRHDGAGLPDKHTGLAWVLIGLLGLVEVLRNLFGVAASDDSVGFSLLYGLWWVVLYLFIGRLMKQYRTFYVVLLLALAGNVLTFVVSLPLGGPPHPLIKLLLVLWQFLALHSFIQRTQQNSKKSND